MKKFLTAALFVLAAAAMASCGATGGRPAGTAEPGESGAEKTLAIGILQDVDSIPLVIARRQGYFDEEEVSVKLETFKSALDRDSALQTGAVDGVISDVLAAAFAKEGGFGVKITSGTDGSYKLLVGGSSGISSLPGLKGRSIAISKNTIIEYSTDRMLEEGGLGPEEVDKTAVKDIPARLEMLQNGKIDAATLPEPLASVALKNGARLLSSSDALGINPGVLLFTDRAIREKPNEIKAFYRAYNRAAEYLNEEPPEAYVDALIKDLSFPDAVKGTLVPPAYGKAAMVGEKDLYDAVSWLLEKQLIKNDYTFDELTDGQFIR